MIVPATENSPVKSGPNRASQLVLVASTVLGSWLGMQAVHETGHVLGTWLTGGRIAQVVLNPLTISRTDLADNPCPLIVAWSGAAFGIAAPLLLWGLAMAARASWAFVLRFFAGFCVLANGVYLALGSIDGIGDCGDMLRHGSKPWHLWLFGAATVPVGLRLWHRLGLHFGLGPARRSVSRGVAYGSLAVFLALLAMGFVVGGK